MEIYVDDEAKLTLHGLVQHYVMLREGEKNRKLNDLLDALDVDAAADEVGRDQDALLALLEGLSFFLVLVT